MLTRVVLGPLKLALLVAEDARLARALDNCDSRGPAAGSAASAASNNYMYEATL